jgi:hypothetical protein
MCVCVCVCVCDRGERDNVGLCNLYEVSPSNLKGLSLQSRYRGVKRKGKPHFQLLVANGPKAPVRFVTCLAVCGFMILERPSKISTPPFQEIFSCSLTRCRFNDRLVRNNRKTALKSRAAYPFRRMRSRWTYPPQRTPQRRLEMNGHTILPSLYYGNPANVYLAPGLLSVQVRHLSDHNNL